MKNAIALLITLLFVMLFSVGIGYSLAQMKSVANISKHKKMLYETTALLDDILTILSTSKTLQQLAENNSTEDLYLFLQNSQSLLLDISGRKVSLSFQSANAKVNINRLNDANEPLFREFFSRYSIGDNYVDLLKEFVDHNQTEPYNYAGALFDENPSLFRQYIASKEHLDIINSFYMREYGDETLKKINFQELFSYNKQDDNVTQRDAVDLNYATPLVYELILGCSAQRAVVLVQNEGSYKSFEDMHLDEEELKNIAKFKTTFFAPFLLVTIETEDASGYLKILFKYDIKLKRGYDFVFEA